MGIAIPQVITPDRATGAQVIDGSLRFDSSKSNRLEKTPFTEGSRTTYTYSVWIKRHTFGEMVVLGAYQDDSNRTRLLFDANDRMQFFTRLSNNSHSLFTDARLRDPSNFYHLVWSVDTTQSTASERVKMYINGVLQTLTGTDYPDQNELTFINKSEEHNIGNGQDSGGDEAFFNGSMSQAYFIDGQQLGPENFGFTDPLTNTWKPKKYTGDFNNLPDINLAGTGSGESIEVVINRQVDKAWIKSNGSSTYEGGGDPSDPSSAPSFHLPSGGSLYWFTTAYDSAHTMVIGSSSETGTQPAWDASGTTGSLTRDSATQVSGTPSSSYASVCTT